MTVLAKLSRPRLAGVHPRERLFARLDDCRERGAVAWVWGPPGAGKTTLAASFVQARSLRTLWFQVDAGDADPASFFYYLGQCARHGGLSKRTHLSLLTPEYLGDLPGFTRRWFRALCDGFPQPCALVLDNLHEASDSSPFAAVIHDALAELPAGVTTILISRAEPPPWLARQRVSGALSEIGWDELQLNVDEVAQFAAASRQAALGNPHELVQRCGGWAAGLTLLLDHAQHATDWSSAPTSRQALFDYFAAELFDRLPPATRELLLRTALLPWVDASVAAALSGNERAGDVLEGLRRRRLFTERRAGSTPSYQYHALLREFLVDRLRQECSADERAELSVASARWLARADQPGAALKLFLDAGDAASAVQLVLEQAPGLAAQGRLQTLAEWIAALPEPSSAADPWFGYWLGARELARDPSAARSRWQSTYERFDAGGDLVGRMACAAGIIETHLIEFRSFTLLDPWIARLQQCLDAGPEFPNRGLELTALGSLIAAMVQRQPDADRLATYAARGLALIGSAPDVNTLVAGAGRLLQYCIFLSVPSLGPQLIEHVRARLDDPQLAPIHVINWLVYQAMYFTLARYDERRATESIQAAIDTMERHGLTHLAMVLHSRAAMIRLQTADVDAAAWHLAQAQPAAQPQRFDVAWHAGLAGCVALLRGDSATAVRGARRFVDANVAGGNLRAQGMALIYLVNALLVDGDLDAAQQALGELGELDEPSTLVTPIGSLSAALVAADVQLAAGDTDAAAASLRRALAIGRENDLVNTLQWLPAQMSRLCAFALERNIEAAYVGRLIRARNVLPPTPDAPHWPWPIEIHCLGRFEIVRDGTSLRFEGKTQRKPLALLKALVALGATDVPQDRLIDVIWPEPLDGDEQKAFDITLHRLRKLLGHDGAIRVGDRRVSLDRDCVWVDLWSLERCLGATQPLPGALPSNEAFESAAPAVLRLYRGTLLDGEPDSPWLLPARHRIAARFQRFVSQLGARWEDSGDWERAVQLYERAIELDMLAEGFYARLMLCLRHQGRRAEAIEVYRRCRQMLSVTLGLKPSQAIDDVYATLHES